MLTSLIRIVEGAVSNHAPASIAQVQGYTLQPLSLKLLS